MMNDNRALLIDSHGEITAPSFQGEADPDHPGGPYWHIRTLIDTAEPGGLSLEDPCLALWIDGHAFDRRRSVNVSASVLLSELLNSPGTMICGPLLITGGDLEHPEPLTREQAARVAADLFDAELPQDEDDPDPLTHAAP